MKNLCLLCGAELNENGVCPADHQIKKMCLNCVSCLNNEQDSEEMSIGRYCVNEENMNDTIKKMSEQLGGYTIKNIELNPLPLKKPTVKCPRWTMNEVTVEETIKTIFNQL